MDEPTVGIDPQSRRAILDTVKDLNRQGMTVLYTTHYMEEAQELSDRVGIIDHGELIALGTQKELTQQVGQTETLILHIGENDDSQALAKSLDGVRDVLEAMASDHEVSVIAHEGPTSAASKSAPLISASRIWKQCFCISQGERLEIRDWRLTSL
jgi:ABC-2 type transport system ATP-binding protein